MEYKLEEILDVIQEINYEWIEFDQNSPIRLLLVTDGDFWGVTWSNGFGDFIISSEVHPDWYDEDTNEYIPFDKVLREAINAQIKSFKGFKLQKYNATTRTH